MPTPWNRSFAYYAALSTNANKTRRERIQGWIRHLVAARKKLSERKKNRVASYYHFPETDLLLLNEMLNEEGTPCAQLTEIDHIIKINSSLTKDYRAISVLHDELKKAQKLLEDQQKLLEDQQKLFEDQKEGLESMIQQRERELESIIQQRERELESIIQQRERELESLNQKLQLILQTTSEVIVQINSEQEERAPSEFGDVFGCEIMDDPVVASDGFTYNRKNFDGWINMGKRVSPTTNAQLVDLNVVPNYSLKSRISEWRDAFERNKPVPDPKKKINSELKERCKWTGVGFLICVVVSIPIFCFLGRR